MPLEKSGTNAARRRNIETEIQSGKPVKQAVAIGYAVQRRAKGGDPVAPNVKTNIPGIIGHQGYVTPTGDPAMDSTLGVDPVSLLGKLSKVERAYLNGHPNSHSAVVAIYRARRANQPR